MIQYIIEAELLPLTAPELMEAQYFHALEASQSGAVVCNAFYVVVPIGEIGHQDKPDPHRPAETREMLTCFSHDPPTKSRHASSTLVSRIDSSSAIILSVMRTREFHQ